MTGRNPFTPPELSREKEQAIDDACKHFVTLLEFIETLATSRDLSLAKQKLEECELWLTKSIRFYGVKR